MRRKQTEQLQQDPIQWAVEKETLDQAAEQAKEVKRLYSQLSRENQRRFLYFIQALRDGYSAEDARDLAELCINSDRAREAEVLREKQLIAELKQRKRAKS